MYMTYMLDLNVEIILLNFWIGKTHRYNIPLNIKMRKKNFFAGTIRNNENYYYDFTVYSKSVVTNVHIKFNSNIFPCITMGVI